MPVRKSDYSASIVPSFLDLKFCFFGHDMVVLHSRDIRKAQDPFSMTLPPELPSF